MNRSVWSVVLGIVCLASIAWGGLEGPQDAWYEVDAWHSWVEGETTNYFGRNICAMAIGPDDRIYALDGTNNFIAVFEQDGTFVRMWGSQGSALGQFNFNQSGAIAFDSTGRVYVTDYSNSRVQVFEPDGTVVTAWGGYSSEDGMFRGPRGIAVGTNGLVYVTDYSNNRVQVFEQDGTFVRKWGSQGSLDGQFSQPPWDVAIGPDGLVYVSCGGHSGYPTEVFDQDGNFIKRLPKNVGANMLFAEGLVFGELGIMTTDGEWLVNRNSSVLVPTLIGDETGVYFDRSSARQYNRDGVMQYQGTIIRCKRRYAQDPIEEWKAQTKPVPNPVILKFEQRPGHYVMDMEYVVKDADSATVMVELGALRDGRNRLDAYIPAKTFLEGTAANVGDAVAPNVSHPVVWDITADVEYEYVNLRPVVMAHSPDRGLWDVEFITLPAESELPELTISRRYFNDGSNDQYSLKPVWQWLAAKGSEEGVELRTNGIYAVEGTYAGQRLAYDYYPWTTTGYDGNIVVTAEGWNFLAARLGYRVATTAEKQRAYAGREWNNYLGSGSSYTHFVKE
jgi:hypothetical protein